MISDAILNQIQDRLDIVEIISAHVPLKRAGRNFKAPCPFHQEKTPSFMVSPDKQIFHCFGCGAGGNVFSFLMKQEKKDFLEVVETLAEQTGVELPRSAAVSKETADRNELFVKVNSLAANFYHEILLNHKDAEKARVYLKDRGIERETILDFKLGCALDSWDGLSQFLRPKASEPFLERAGLLLSRKDGGFYDRFRNRVIFPILDGKGVCVAFGARVLDDSLPKYLNSPETEIYTKGKNLYGLFQARKAIREKDLAVVVEGYMDLIACHKAGVRHSVASLGTALTPDQARLLKRHTKNILILYDADAAGEMATLRGIDICLEEGLEVKVVRLPEGHDPDSFVRKFGAASFEQVLGQARSLFEYRLSLLKQSFDSKTLEGRVKIANEMVPLFSKLRNEILKNAWVRELAKELSLSEESLLEEIGKRRDAQPVYSRPIPASPVKEEMRVVEKLLIGLFLEEAGFVKRAKGEIAPGDFQNPVTREMMTRFFKEDAASLKTARWVTLYQGNAEAIHLISQASAEIETVVDREKTFTDCVLWLKKSRVRREQESLRSRLVEAQRGGDETQVQKLLYDLNQLNKGMKKTDAKK